MQVHVRCIIKDEFIFERYGEKDDFWKMGYGKHCSEAWDAISRYICTGLQGGSIMRNWMNDDHIMIYCCSDGTRPVIFKIERIDYKVPYIEGIENDEDKMNLGGALLDLEKVKGIEFKKDFTELIIEKDIDDN